MLRPGAHWRTMRRNASTSPAIRSGLDVMMLQSAAPELDRPAYQWTSMKSMSPPAARRMGSAHLPVRFS